MDNADRLYFLSKPKEISQEEKVWMVACYIENNPLRARVVKKAEDYKYSIARTNLLGEDNEIITKDIIQSRQKAYKEFFYDPGSMNKEHIRQIAEIIRQEKVLGTVKFITCMEEKLKICLKVRGRGRPAKRK